MNRIAILISGRGSNMQSLVRAVATDFNNTYKGACVSVVISNEPDAAGLAFAESAGIATHAVDHRKFPEREAHEQALIDIIDSNADIVLLAGYMRILSKLFVERYKGRLLNIHPSLLPAYPGLDTHQRAINAHDSNAGASVHFVIPALDAGPVIIQAQVPVQQGDDSTTLAVRVLDKEHIIYPMALRWLLDGTIQLDEATDGTHFCLFHDQRLTEPLQLDNVLNNEFPQNLQP